MTRLFWLSLLAFPLAAFDAATEVAQLREAMNRAYAANIPAHPEHLVRRPDDLLAIQPHASA
jgi:hypothetical protein